MKKLLAIAMMAVLVLAMAVPALAAKSPVADEVHKVQIVDGNNTKPQTESVNKDESTTLTADTDKGTFDGWKIYLKDGKTEAVLGEHYTLGEGQSLSASTIVLFPKTDLIVTGNYNGVDTKVEVNDNGEVVSPETGDATVVVLGSVMMLALAGMVMLKKRAA